MPNSQSKEQSRKAYKQSAKQKSEKNEQATAESQSRKQQKEKQKEEKRTKAKQRRRVFPIWLRIIVVLLLAAGALIIGLMIGFGVIGDGNPIEILNKETWEHVVDIVIQGT
ncbi:DNA-directed RNA polymerase subunit beta [Virgibacillus ainsalahensis]